MRHLSEYVKGGETIEPEYVGFFNGGQKLQFWEIVIGGGVLLITGLFMWFPEIFGRLLVAISYVLHDISALIMLGGIVIHIYLSTVGQPGTFRAMTRGVVTRSWAWTHHPAWYKETTGRNPHADYQHALKRQRERRQETEAIEPDAESNERKPDVEPTKPSV
jgi:formate dehydrogenase subunit gamma